MIGTKRGSCGEYADPGISAEPGRTDGCTERQIFGNVEFPKKPKIVIIFQPFYRIVVADSQAFDGVNPRSMIGVTSDRTVYMVVVDGRQSGKADNALSYATLTPF